MLLQHLHALIFAPASDLLSESNSSICSRLETKSRGGSVAPPSMRPDSPPPTNHDDDDGRRDGSRTQQASAAVRVNGRVRAGGPVQRGLVNMRTKEAQRRRRRWWWQRRTGGPTVDSHPQLQHTHKHSSTALSPPLCRLGNLLLLLLHRGASMPSACPRSQNALFISARLTAETLSMPAHPPARGQPGAHSRACWTQEGFTWAAGSWAP